MPEPYELLPSGPIGTQDVKRDETIRDILLRHPYTPFILALIADACFVIMDILVLSVEKVGVAVGEVVFIRMVITATYCLIHLGLTNPLAIHPTSLFDLTSENKYLWLRGIMTSTSLAATFANYKYITIAESITVFHLRPFPVAFLCFIFLGERFSKIQIWACLSSIGGILLVVHPQIFTRSPGTAEIDVPLPGHRVLGFSLAFFVLIVCSVDFLILRKVKKANVHVVQLTYAIGGMITSPLWSLATSETISLPTSIQWVTLLFVAITGYCAQLCVVLALQMEQGGTIAVLGYAQVVIAVFFQWLVFSVIPTIQAFIGMSVMILAGVWATLMGRPEVEAANQFRRDPVYYTPVGDDADA